MRDSITVVKTAFRETRRLTNDMKDCDEGNESETHDNNHSLQTHTAQCESRPPKSAARYNPL